MFSGQPVQVKDMVPHLDTFGSDIACSLPSISLDVWGFCPVLWIKSHCDIVAASQRGVGFLIDLTSLSRKAEVLGANVY